MTGLAKAALAYSLSVFSIGFALGTFRVLVLLPRIGEAAAVLLELPVMIAGSYLLAVWTVARWQVPARFPDRAAMGALAFAALMLLEFSVSVLIFGNTPRAHLAHYAQPISWLGLSGQIVFAAMPALLLLDRSRR
jgi:hypothetical protein